MRRAAAVLALAALGCTRHAPTTHVDVEVRNDRAAAVVVTPWRGASPVAVPPHGWAQVSGDAPPEPWTVRVADQASGRELHEAKVRLNGANSLVVHDGGVGASDEHDGLGQEER